MVDCSLSYLMVDCSLLGMILGFVTDHLLSVFYVISSVRNLCRVCCDSAIMSGEGGGTEARGEGETDYFNTRTVSMFGSCFA